MPSDIIEVNIIKALYDAVPTAHLADCDLTLVLCSLRSVPLVWFRVTFSFAVSSDLDLFIYRRSDHHSNVNRVFRYVLSIWEKTVRDIKIILIDSYWRSEHWLSIDTKISTSNLTPHLGSNILKIGWITSSGNVVYKTTMTATATMTLLPLLALLWHYCHY